MTAPGTPRDPGASPRREQVFTDPSTADEQAEWYDEHGTPARAMDVAPLGDQQYGDRMASTTVLSSAQVKGAVVWGAIGAVALGALGFLVGWMFPLDAYSSLTTAELVALCGALAGGVSGAVYGGGRRPEVEHEAMPPEAKVTSNDVRIIAVKASTDPDAIHVDRSDLGDVPTLRADDRSADPASDLTSDPALRRPTHEPAFNDPAVPLPHRPVPPSFDRRERVGSRPTR